MRKIFLLLTCLFSAIISMAQFNPVPVKQGTPTQILQAQGAYQGKLGFILPVNDTTGNPATSFYGAVTVLPSDTTNLFPPIYMTNGHFWFDIGKGININDTVYVDAPLYAYFDSTGHQHIAIQQQDGLVGACPVVWDSLLVFSVPPCNYVINGTFYTSPATTITLDAADPTNPRYDLFIVDTVPEATKITGTPAAIPTIPQVDPQSQIALTSGFLINPGDTVPNNATQKLIYDENAGTPTEWAFTTSGTLTANANNTDNPKHKTKAIFVSSYTNNSKLNFLSASTDTFNTNNGQVLWGYVYFNGAFLNKFKFQFFNGSTAVSSALTINNTFGINPNDSNRYQLFSIPLSAFTWTNTVFDKLVITHVGTDNSGAKGYYIDWINIQSGVMPIPSPIDYSNKADSAGTYKINDSTYITRTWVKGSSFPVGDTIHASSTGGGGGGSGTVTSISQGYGITNTPNPITTTGTVKSDTTAHATSTNTGYLSNIDWQAFHGKVDSVTKNTSQDSFYVWTNGNHTALKDSSGGVGGTNVNIGTGYRLAVPNTNNIKTLNPLFGILMDSTTASNTISLKIDTINAITSKLRGDSLAAAIALKLNKTDTTNKWVSNIYRKVGVDSIFFQIGSTQYSILDSAGTGTVTSISQGYGITNTPNPITATGTVTADTTKLIPYTDTLKANGIATETWVTNKISGQGSAWGTYAQRVAIASPATGQRFYQTDERIGLWQYTGTSWEFILPMKTRGIFNNVIAPTTSTSGTGSSSAWGQVGSTLDSSFGYAYVLSTGTTSTGRGGFQYGNSNTGDYPTDTTYAVVTYLRVMFDTTTSTDNFTVRFGFGSQNINTSGTDNYGTYFRIDNDSAASNVETETRNNNGTVWIGTNTGVTQSSLKGRFHDFVIVSNTITTKYYIDGTLYVVDKNPFSGSVSTIGPGPVFVCSITKRTGTTSKNLSVSAGYSYITKIY